MINDSKHDLEDHIDMLRELDAQRKESATLRDKGIQTLIDHKQAFLDLKRNHPIRP